MEEDGEFMSGDYIRNLEISKHWKVLVILCGLSAASIGLCINSMGVFYVPASENLGILRGTFAFHQTISTITSATVALFILKFIKSDNFKMILLSGTILASLSTFLLAFSNEIRMIYILSFIRGIGTALFGIVVITVIINNWFIGKHGLAASIVMSFAGIIGAIAAPFFNWIINTFGWQSGYMVMGILIFLFTLPSVIYKFSFSPFDEGILPYGDSEKPEGNGKSNMFKYLSICYLCIFVYGVFISSITAVPQHFAGFAESIGLGNAVGSLMISACMIGNLLSKLLIGVLSDRIGYFKATIAMLSINILAAILLLFGSSELVCLIGAFLFGSIYSVAAVGTVLAVKHIFGNENYSAAYPAISFAGNVGCAIAMSLVGYAYDYTQVYTSVFVSVIVLIVLSVVLLLITVKRRELCH